MDNDDQRDNDYITVTVVIDSDYGIDNDCWIVTITR